MIHLVTDLRIAARNLWRNTNRTLVAMLTVGGGVAALLLAGGFIAWIFQEMREATIHSQLGHLQIVRPGYFEKGIANPYAYLLPQDSAEQEYLRQLPGVASVTERLAFSGLASLGEATVPFVGEGVVPEGERLLSSRMTMIEGRDLAAVNESAVLLGEGLARTLGAKPGGKVVLLATAANGSTNAVEVTVAGVFASASQDYDESALRLPIAVARKLMRVKSATSWVVLLGQTDQTDPVAETIAQRLSSTDFEVVPWSALADFYNKTVVLFSRQVEVVRFIIGLIIVLTISNTQTMSVLERTTEIGTSLAIGLRRRAVMRMFMIEGGIIGLFGGVFGVVMGLVLAAAISAVGIPMPPPPGMAHGFVGQILVTPALALDGWTLAMVTTLVASVMPAWKASRMNVVDALRTNQ